MFLSIRGRVLIKGYGLESLQDSGVLEIIELQKELELERTTTVTLLIWMMSLSLRRRGQCYVRSPIDTILTLVKFPRQRNESNYFERYDDCMSSFLHLVAFARAPLRVKLTRTLQTTRNPPARSQEYQCISLLHARDEVL